ncbi:MAG: hypothetical protein AAGF12_43110 [Myxococcota bacterium]
MATKRLARTVIEGGRDNRNKSTRRQTHRVARAKERRATRRIQRDLESVEGLVVPTRTPVRKGFRDKLGPAERWLRSRVGKPWHEVEGEILRVFNLDTIAGRHIAVDHLLPRWTFGSRGYWWVHRSRFSIDEAGRLAVDEGRQRRPLERGPCRDCAERWAKGRRVGIRGTKLYWMLPSRPPSEFHETRYRQDRRLSRQEEAFFRSLGPTARQAVTHRRDPRN